MKLLTIILLFTFTSCNAQLQLTDTIPESYYGTWVNFSNNDTIIVSSNRIDFTTVNADFILDEIDLPMSITTTYYTFISNHGNRITLNKVSRNKLIFNATSENTLLLRDDTYHKLGTRF